MSDHASALAPARGAPAAFVGGAVIGTLGGLIGLGGAEFRLPLLIGMFRFAALQAVILNKAMSLIVVASALLFRQSAVPFEAVAASWPILVNLLAGSLLGAWLGAGWATRIAPRALYRIIAALLVVIAIVLLFGHDAAASEAWLTGVDRMMAGVIAGFAIGVVASLLGVAGGELLIPTLILLFGVDLKLAGSLSLAISLPTVLVGFARYSRDAASSCCAKTAASWSSWRSGRSSAASSAAVCSAWSQHSSCCRCWRPFCCCRPSRSGGTRRLCAGSAPRRALRHPPVPAAGCGIRPLARPESGGRLAGRWLDHRVPGQEPHALFPIEVLHDQPIAILHGGHIRGRRLWRRRPAAPKHQPGRLGDRLLSEWPFRRMPVAWSEAMSVGTIVIVLLILVLIGVLPTWGHSRSWGYFPSGGVGILVVILLVLLLSGRL